MGTRPKAGPGRPRSQGCHRCGPPPVEPHRPEGTKESFEMQVPEMGTVTLALQVGKRAEMQQDTWTPAAMAGQLGH